MSVRPAGWVLSCCAMIGVFTGGVRAATPEEVDSAIKKGVEWLYSAQDEDGGWDSILKPNAEGKWSGDVKQAGGPTAMAVYALITCGQDPKDPRIVKAVDYLKKTPSGGVYAIGFRANAYASLPVADDLKRLIAADANWIRGAMRLGKDINLRGFYGYGSGPKAGNDRSTSQIAVLGAWGCAQAGINLGEDYWRQIEDAWRKNQKDDGGWNYAKDRPESMSMTSAGVATLFITQEYLHANDFSECKGSYIDPAIDKGLKYMGDHFAEFTTTQQFYTLYAIERCGYASGYKYFGEHNWFQEGADWLIKGQSKEGSWGGGANFNTSFALLFLGRGRSPVALTKLQYGKDDVGELVKNLEPTEGNWNARPRDAANISKWAGKAQERILNYQKMGIDAPLKELQDAPIIYISGNQPLKFSEEKMQKLRAFVEEGGLIVGNADCSNKLFVESFRQLGNQMFPTYEWRALPPSHPILANEQFLAKNWKTPLALQGLSNGSRELMLLLSNGDPGKYWQLHMLGGKEEMHQGMANIFSYAIEREGNRYKGVSNVVHVQPEILTDRRVKVGRLKYAGNWDPEPGGWRRLAAIVHNTQKLELAIEPVELGQGKLDDSFTLIHLTGTAAYTLTSTAKEEIKTYIEAGGTLLVDVCGGGSEFATTIEPELVSLFAAGKSLQLLPPEHKLFTADLPYATNVPKLTTVDFRPYAKTRLGDASGTVPLIKYASVNNRTAVYYSSHDLSTGLVGAAVDGVIGYAPSSATTIIERLVLALSPKPQPKPKEGEEPKPAEEKPPEPKPAEAKPAEDKPAAEKAPEVKPPQ